MRVHLLRGDYKSAIQEGEKLLAQDAAVGHSDELYYLLGLSYLKEENYLRASDIFEIILKEFDKNNFRDEAILGLGDTEFLRGNFSKAESHYRQLLSGQPDTKFKALIYYRLSRIGFKNGNTEQAEVYLGKLKQEFPLNQELLLNKDIPLLPDTSGFYYTVQVGSFFNITNAQNLEKKLIQKGYPAYIEDTELEGRHSYRVRVGKFNLRKLAEDWQERLSSEGFPTKIYP